jgi:K+-sensing histidine kinase KdpD
LGTALCLSAAGIAAFAFRSVPLKSFLPLLFLSVVLLVALRFGTAAGILGTIGAAIIFAEFLFDPMLSIRVSESSQRDHLVWMVIIGIAMSELIGIQPKPPDGRGTGQPELRQTDVAVSSRSKSDM